MLLWARKTAQILFWLGIHLASVIVTAGATMHRSAERSDENIPDYRWPRSVSVLNLPTITTLPAFHARMATNLVAAGTHGGRFEVGWYTKSRCIRMRRWVNLVGILSLS